MSIDPYKTSALSSSLSGNQSDPRATDYLGMSSESPSHPVPYQIVSLSQAGDALHVDCTQANQETAAQKISDWYRVYKSRKDGKEMRQRCALIDRNQAPVPFTVERVFHQKKREVLAKEISQITTWYAERQDNIEEDSLEEHNYHLWIQIENGLSLPSLLPIVVRDRSGELQAVALINTEEQEPVGMAEEEEKEEEPKQKFELASIATAPHNLGPVGKYRGAATAAIEDALFLCKRWKFSTFYVDRDGASIPFYERIGITSNCFAMEQFPAFLATRGGKARPVFD